MQTQHPFFKRKTEPTLRIVVQQPFFLIYRKYVKGLCTFKFIKFINKVLSKCQCGFCQVYSAQHCLLITVEKRRQYLRKGGVSGTLITDLSKPLTAYNTTF